MFKISAYEYVYLHTLDIGDLLADADVDGAGATHDDLLDLRSKGRVDHYFLDELSKRFADNARDFQFGTFIGREEEGKLLKERIESACADGGKRIFTQHFLSYLAPTIFEREERVALFDSGDRANPPITPSEPCRLSTNRALYYKGARMRFFQNGCLGLELRFSYNDRSDQAPIDANSVIRDIRSLEEDYVRDAALRKFEAVFRTLSRDPAIQGYVWRKNWFERDRFLRLGARHRVLLLKSLGDDSGREFDLELDGSLPVALKEVAGILNRAEWYSEYWTRYLKEIEKKFIAYQRNEVFITDGNSSLFYFPGYWTRSLNKRQYIENTISSLHYLLSWEALRGYFEEYINQANGRAVVLASRQHSEQQIGRAEIRQEFYYLTKLRQVVGSFRDALAVGSLVNHGFTARVLEQFLDERALRQGNDEMSIKLERFSESLEFAASFVRSDGESKEALYLQKWEVRAGLLALIVGSIFSILSFLDIQWKDVLALFNQSEIVEPEKPTTSNNRQSLDSGRRNGSAAAGKGVTH